MKLVIGAQVKWTSQAGSVSKEKVGEVVAVIPPKKLPSKEDFPSLYRGAGIGSSRSHESYVIRVKTGATASRIYWPRVNGLSVVERDGGEDVSLAAQVKEVLVSELSDSQKLAQIAVLVG